MATITKKDLIDRIAEDASLKRVDVKRIVQTLLDEMTRELGEGNRLEFRDFGVFEPKARAARTAQNPKTLERVDVPAKRTVKFKIGRLMQKCVDDPEGMREEMDERAAQIVITTRAARNSVARASVNGKKR